MEGGTERKAGLRTRLVRPEDSDSINLNRKSECNLKMPVCAVFINYMCIIWNAGVEVEYTLHNEYYYLLQVRTCMEAVL